MSGSNRADEFAAFVELEHSGMSYRQIAQQLGVSGRTVTRWRRRIGRPVGVPAVPRPQSDRDFAWRLLEDGCSIAETARTVGVKATTILRWFPDAPRYTHQQAGQLSVLARMEKQIRERTTP